MAPKQNMDSYLELPGALSVAILVVLIRMIIFSCLCFRFQFIGYVLKAYPTSRQVTVQILSYYSIHRISENRGAKTVGIQKLRP